MNDKQRYEYLTDHFNSLRFTDEFKLSRVNYNFLLVGYNKQIAAKIENKKLIEENKQLNLQIKLLEMGVKI